jgi:hypothetical protein
MVQSENSGTRAREYETHAQPKTKANEQSVAEHVLQLLRSLGVADRDLRTVRLNAKADASEMVRYDAGSAMAELFTRHPLVSSSLIDSNTARTHRILAMAVLGAMNRAVQRFTDADELRVLQEMLTLVAEQEQRAP